jgi:hypothetical protein
VSLVEGLYQQTRGSRPCTPQGPIQLSPVLRPEYRLFHSTRRSLQRLLAGQAENLNEKKALEIVSASRVAMTETPVETQCRTFVERKENDPSGGIVFTSEKGFLVVCLLLSS